MKDGTVTLTKENYLSLSLNISNFRKNSCIHLCNKLTLLQDEHSKLIYKTITTSSNVFNGCVISLSGAAIIVPPRPAKKPPNDGDLFFLSTIYHQFKH